MKSEKGDRHKALDVLERYWGYRDFRPGQWPLIEAAITGNDAIGVLPTGAGKSICFQVPAVLSVGLTLVISPLIALMEEQTETLNERGISAANLSGSLSPRAYERVLNDARYGQYRILYISPERLLSERFRAQATSLNVSLLAVDEAHCISEWGHEFRPAYVSIADIYPILDRPPVLALTATATPRVREDIVTRLHLNRPTEIIKSFDRANLSFSVFRSVSKREKVKEIFSVIGGSGILYAPTRRRVEAWGRILRQAGESVSVYHAGISSADRTSSQTDWLTEKTRIMVATNAFGMGVDKAGVRAVVHVGLPMSLESYYQEAGRAGRDRQKAYAALLFDENDIDERRSMLSDMYPRVADIRSVFDTCMSLNSLAVGSESEEDLKIDLELIRRVTGFSIGRIRYVIRLLEREQILLHHPGRSDSSSYSVPRSEFENLRLSGPRPPKLTIDYRRRRRLKRQAADKLRDVLDYAAETGCRRQRLVAHFDDFSTEKCGMCDNCLGRHRPLLIEPTLNDTMRTALQYINRQQESAGVIFSPTNSGIALPAYRIEEIIEWLSLQGYIHAAEDPGLPPKLTALGLAVVRG